MSDQNQNDVLNLSIKVPEKAKAGLPPVEVTPVVGTEIKCAEPSVIIAVPLSALQSSKHLATNKSETAQYAMVAPATLEARASGKNIAITFGARGQGFPIGFKVA